MENKIEEKKNINIEIKENNIEKSLVKKGEKSLKPRNTYLIKPVLQTTAGVLFYVASFVVAMAFSYMFIFSVFE